MLREIVVLSGKGGTGKTSIVGSFAVLAENKVMADCDVDAADLNLLLQPKEREEHEFWSGQSAVIDIEKCVECNLCEEICRFDAIKDYIVDPISCEGCGLCASACTLGAIEMQDNMAGHWFISDTKYGPLVHARLGIAQENSGKLVATVRKQARLMAEQEEASYIISDGPPGIGCPVISSLSGANLALVVTEPTLSGINDLERVLGVCHHYKIPSLVCINKYDINEENSSRIEDFCDQQGVKVAARIPFDEVVPEAVAAGVTVVEYSQNGISQKIEKLWQSVVELVKTKEE